jgi:23S rRNA (adenine2503-C2)-methyltransferase
MTEALLGRDTGELTLLAQREGEPAYRGRQLVAWIYQRRACSYDDMSDLPAALRARFSQLYAVGCPSQVAKKQSTDGTFKLLLEMRDGARVEAVGLPYEDRFSCCVSTQVGCAVGCLFCATGLSGFVRNLDAGEIVGQVLAVERESGSRIDHVTFMGMGEPLMNYDATLKALRLLNVEKGIAARSLTVSTSGYVPGIVKLAREKLQITLAISLHAAHDELRKRLVPGMTRWPISELMAAAREYLGLTNRRLTFEYCMLDGVNDSLDEAKRLTALLRGMNCHINLIPYNRVTDLNLKPSSDQQVKAFRQVLSDAGIQVTQRQEKGADIDAACGQLRRRISM